jgi:hypothetical protein
MQSVAVIGRKRKVVLQLSLIEIDATGIVIGMEIA